MNTGSSNNNMKNSRSSPMPESIKSRATSHSRGQGYNIDKERGENGPSYGGEYVSRPASDNIVEEDDERTPLISCHVVKSTVKQTVFNAVNILMGIAVLSLPFAFKCAGWFFGISIFLFCLIQTNYTAKTIKKCLDIDPECITYADLAHLAFGNKGKLIIGGMFLMDLLNAAVALMILIGDSLKALFPNVDIVYLKLIIFVIVTPLSWCPISRLSHVSILGIVSVMSLAIVIIIDGFKPESPGSLLKPMDTNLFPPNWMALPLAFGLINAGFTGHAVFPSLYRDMAKPGSYNKMVDNSYLITSAVYIIVAVCGYLMFGSETLAEITLNIMSTPGFSVLLNSMVVWLIVISPLCKYPLLLIPINQCFEIGFFRMMTLRSKDWERFFIIISRTLLSFVILSISILLPEFDRAMSLLGSLFSFLISGIFPLLCYVKMFGHQLSKKELAFNMFLLVMSSIMAITGTIWTFFPREWIGNEILD